MLQEICKYFDSFGTKYNFFTDGKPKLYTTLGGILTIISILLSIIVFICFSLDDFRRKTPTTLFSSVLSEEHRKIKFKNEKIWVPWRIVDYNNNFVNHTGLIYPVINYYDGQRKSVNDTFVFKEKKINYKLCNETNMINKPETYYLDVPLNNLYCIDMDDLDMGGSWLNLYLNFIKMDFYLCEKGIDYNKSNQKCTTYEKINDRIGPNNSLKIEFYYPDVQFQTTNKNNPITILYRQHFYHISKYTNKIDRLFLQQHILSDDYGWLYRKISNSSYWGYSSFSGDSYTTTNEKDLINEGSTSRVYSLNIYLEPSVMNYIRAYKKLLTIITQSIPLLYFVLVIFRNIAKLFKLTEQKRKIVELLFENLKEKKRRKFQITTKNKNNNINTNTRNSEIGFMKINYLQKGNINNKIINNPAIVEEIHESDPHMDKKDSTILHESSNINKKYTSILQESSNINKKYSTILQESSNINKKYTTILHEYSNKNKKAKSEMEGISFLSNYCFLNNNMNSKNDLQKNVNPIEFLNSHKKITGNKSMKIRRKSVGGILEDNVKVKISNLEDNFENMENIANEHYFIKGELFPYSYYLYSVFIKSIDMKKCLCCFSKKYIKVHTFISQMFDISSYLLLLREFELVKRIYFKDAELNVIERNKKINVNTKTFSRNINECIDKKKFNIFAKNILY